MTKSSLTRVLLLAGVVAAAGVAQAGTFDSPYNQAGEASTMTHGAPNLLTTNQGDSSSYVYSETDPTLVLGAGPATVTVQSYSYTYPAGVYSSSYPAPVVNYTPGVMIDPSASATSNIPDRAGEASTMTNGVPNLSTNNY
jgi:hypothetical protein